MHKPRVFFSVLLSALTASALAQQPWGGLKTNLLYDATTTLNGGFELGISPKQTLDLSANLNLWTFSNDKKFKHWLLQPEWRFWTKQRFSGCFIGIYAHFGQFNVRTKSSSPRYEGWLYGIGASYGYQWQLGNRWHMEAELGLGYVHFDYDKFGCCKCGKLEKSGHHNYFGPTKVALTLIYMIGPSSDKD